MRILFLATAVSIHTVKWVNYFAENGHEIYLVSHAPLAGLLAVNVNLRVIKKKFPIKMWPFNTLLNFPFALLDVKRIIREFKPDLINAHYITSYGHLAALTGFHPLVSTAWGSDILISSKESRIARWIVKYVLKKSDVITCDANHMKSAMIKLGVDGSKVKIINFGIDTDKFRPMEKDSELVKILGTEGKSTIISLRILEPIYNIETFIRSIPVILKKYPNVKFIIGGDGSEKEKLKKMVQDLNIENNVAFIGWIKNDELPKYINLADIYVSTSLSDGGISSSTAEAMSCGLPSIVTDGGDNKLWVRNGENGFTIPVKNPGVLAKKIIYLLDNREQIKRLGKKGREIILEKNDYRGEMAKMEQIYKQLIN